jgi:sugar phosphate isomerase/epimerase
MHNRRNFLQLSGMAVLGAAMPELIKPFAMKDPAKLSVQLYSIRDQISKDIKTSLKKLADIGFKNVETAFWPKETTMLQAAGYLKKYDLQVSSCHIEIPIDKTTQQAMLDTASIFNCKKMIWHGWPEDKRYSSLEGTKELIKIYNAASHFAKDNGLQFGLHNHWWEYRNKVDGKLLYEILNEELDPAIFFEVDTYWVKVAGHNPASIIEKLGERVKLMHIKDGPAVFSPKLLEDKPDPMTAVGKGTQNFPAIVKAGTHAEWLVIEMDTVAADADVFDLLQQSFDYMINNKFALQ